MISLLNGSTVSQLTLQDYARPSATSGVDLLTFPTLGPTQKLQICISAIRQESAGVSRDWKQYKLK